MTLTLDEDLNFLRNFIEPFINKLTEKCEIDVVFQLMDSSNEFDDYVKDLTNYSYYTSERSDLIALGKTIAVNNNDKTELHVIFQPEFTIGVEKSLDFQILVSYHELSHVVDYYKQYCLGKKVANIECRYLYDINILISEFNAEYFAIEHYEMIAKETNPNYNKQIENVIDNHLNIYLDDIKKKILQFNELVSIKQLEVENNKIGMSEFFRSIEGLYINILQIGFRATGLSFFRHGGKLSNLLEDSGIDPTVSFFNHPLWELIEEELIRMKTTQEFLSKDLRSLKKLICQFIGQFYKTII